jgi:hypothetical protein
MHYDMNPDNLDPRVRAARRASVRPWRSSRFTAFGIFCALAALTFYGAVIFVVIHFITKFW